MDKPNYRLQLTLTPRQSHLIEKALDLFVRIGIGQIRCLEDEIDRLFALEDTNELHAHLQMIQEKVIGQSWNGSYGISHPKVHTDVKTVYDCLKVLEKGIAQAEDHHQWSVWHDGAILHLGDEPVATYTINEAPEGPISEESHA
jgi:hypothetical protein